MRNRRRDGICSDIKYHPNGRFVITDSTPNNIGRFKGNPAVKNCVAKLIWNKFSTKKTSIESALTSVAKLRLLIYV